MALTRIGNTFTGNNFSASGLGGTRPAGKGVTSIKYPIIMGGGGGGGSGSTSSYQTDPYAAAMAAAQSQQLYDLLSKQADKSTKARTDSLKRIMDQFKAQRQSLNAMPGFDASYERTRLGETLAGDEQKAMDDLSAALGRPPTATELDMLRRSGLGAQRVGEADITERGRQAEMAKYGHLSELNAMLAEIENRYHPEYDYEKYMPLMQAGAQAQGYAMQGQGGIGAGSQGTNNPALQGFAGKLSPAQPANKWSSGLPTPTYRVYAQKGRF
jgi:hypothetical protein